MPGPQKGTKYNRGACGLQCLHCNDRALKRELAKLNRDERTRFFLWVVKATGRQETGEILQEYWIGKEEES